MLAKIFLPIAFFITLALPLAAYADVYFYSDPDGVTQITDKEIKGRTADKIIRSPRAQTALDRPSSVSIQSLRKRQGASSEGSGVLLLSPLAGPLPIKGRITSLPGNRRDPFNGLQRMHNGVDIAVPSGTPIKTIAPGTVAFSGSNGGFGNVVVVDHGNGVSLYAHLERTAVVYGDTVIPGQLLGFTGNSGRSTGPHLHFEVWENGQNITQQFIAATPLADRTQTVAKAIEEPIRMLRQSDGSILLTNQKAVTSRSLRQERLPDGSILLSY